MKTLSKSIANLSLAGLLVIGSVSIASAQRGGFRGGFSHVSYRGGAGFYGGASMRTGAVFGFRGFYQPYIYANVGLWINTLPFGYYPFYWGLDPYYYYDGVFYQPGANDGYQVATPPVGAELPSIPAKASQVVIDGKQYFNYNGVYYTQITKDDGTVAYIVAGKNGRLNTEQDDSVYHQNPIVGDVADQLPENSHKVTINGKKYWVTPTGVYLEKVKMDDKTVYRVSSVPEEAGTPHNNL